MNVIRLSQGNGKYYRYIGELAVLTNGENIVLLYSETSAAYFVLITERLVGNICRL